MKNLIYIFLSFAFFSNAQDIKVESFDVDVSTDGSTYTLTNDVGNLNSAFIRINSGTRKSSGGPIASTGNAAPHITTVGATLTATNTITWERVNSTTVKEVGEVWRYEGSPGGENEFIVRGRFALNLTGPSVSAAVSGIVNVDNCVPFYTGNTCNDTSTADWEMATVSLHMDDSGNVIASRNNSGTTNTVYVTVVEFTGSNWSVGHGVATNHDAAMETVTLNTSIDGTGGSVFDVGDWSTAWIEATLEGDTSETGLADTFATARPAAGTTQVIFGHSDGDGNSRNDGDGHIHVIKNDDLIVTRRSQANSVPEGNGAYGVVAWPTGASTTRNIDELALEWYVNTSGTGTAHARGSLATRITDATGTITHWVHRSGNSVDAEYAIIDLSQLVGVPSSRVQNVYLNGQVDEAYFGSTLLDKIYLGENLIFEKQ